MKDIFYQFKDAIRTSHVLIPWTTARVLKAGTPVSAAGEVANNGDAVGLLIHNGDVGETVVENGVAYIYCEIAIAGYVDLTAVEEMSGLTIADSCKGALTDIVFVDGKLAGGGGSSGAEIVYVTYGPAVENDSGAEWSIYVDGVELTTAEEVREYLTQVGVERNVIRLRYISTLASSLEWNAVAAVACSPAIEDAGLVGLQRGGEFYDVGVFHAVS